MANRTLQLSFVLFLAAHSRCDSKEMLSDDLQENREGSLVHGEERLQAVTSSLSGFGESAMVTYWW